MALLNLSLPVIGQSSATEDQKVRDALNSIQTEVNGNIDAANLKDGAITSTEMATAANGGPGAEAFHVNRPTNVLVTRANVFPFDTELFDKNNRHAAGTFTCGRAGLYRFSALLGCTAVAGTWYYTRLVRTSGASTTRFSGILVKTTGADPEPSSLATATLELAVNDTVAVDFDSASVSLTLSGYFCGEYIGPS